MSESWCTKLNPATKCPRLYLAALVACVVAVGCGKEPKGHLVRDQNEQGLWGFVDSTKAVIVDYNYQNASEFDKGIAAVKKDGHWGFVDSIGKEIINPAYEAVNTYPKHPDGNWTKFNSPSFDAGMAASMGTKEEKYAWTLFNDGLLAVKQEGKWGLIEKSGKQVTPFKYDWIFPYHEGIALVSKDNLFGFIDRNGKEITSTIYQGRQGGSKLDDKIAYWSSEGMVPVERDYKCGFINRDGKEVIPCQFSRIGGFHDGLARVEKIFGDPINDPRHSSTKWFFIDRQGREAISFGYERAGDFSEGLAAVQLHGLKGYINAKGQEVISAKYTHAGEFSGGVAVVSNNRDSYGGEAGPYFLIDSTGQPRTTEKYASILDFHEGLAAFRDGSGLWGFLDRFGKEIIAAKYRIVGDFDQGKAWFRNTNGGEGFVTRDGKESFTQ